MMNDERYVRKGYKIWDTYSDREVQELNYRSQSDYMCEVLNEKESRINTLEGLDMSEKQFVLYEHKGDYYILKNPRLHLDFIEMLGDALTSEEIVEELNQLNDKVVELAEENKQLKEQLQMIKRIIQTQITEKEEDLRTSVKGGMPTGGLYSEIGFLEKLKKELFDDE